MKKLIILSLVLSMFSCGELTDFTIVENPNLSETSVVGQPNSSAIWLTGMERQLSLFLNEIVINAELASDNYNNDQTFFNQFLDGLNITAQDSDIEDIEFDLNRLREMAKFGLAEVGPNDPNYSAETEAEYNFLLGMAYLYAATYYSAFPGEPGGIPISDTDNFSSAATAFNTAIGLSTKPEYHLALARVHYLQGNKSAATAAAAAAVGASADFTRFATFDEVEEPSNIMENALYERGTFDDLQPLPTLDFLDPKYSFFTAAEDSPIHYLKAEEAHFIMIEAMISDGNLSGAQDEMKALAGLIASRGARSIDDSIEGRTHFAPGSRPDSACVVVNGRAGLVLERQEGNVDIPDISGTSLTEAEIDGISNEDEALYLLYRTRQEVFIAEGMRMVDMGVKIVISEVEQVQNENVREGDAGTVAQIPSFIASVKDQLDEITYDAATCTATTTVDVTQLLVDNKGAAGVLPFH